RRRLRRGRGWGSRRLRRGRRGSWLAVRVRLRLGGDLAVGLAVVRTFAPRGPGEGQVGRLVVLEEVPPGRVDRVLVLEVLLVDLVDEPFVGAEPGHRGARGDL